MAVDFLVHFICSVSHFDEVLFQTIQNRHACVHLVIIHIFPLLQEVANCPISIILKTAHRTSLG